MFNPQLWKLSRYMFDDNTTKQSTNIGIGAGLGLLAAGSGILPALAGVSMTIFAAGALRGLWDNYKLKNATITQQEVNEKFRVVNGLDDKRSGLTKAAAFNNLIDGL
jgi:hypothetical protein